MSRKEKDKTKESTGRARKVVKRILIGLGILLGAVLVFAIGLILWLSITEYRPADRVELTVTPAAASAGTELPAAPTETGITIMTWNIGYGALGDNCDFFMDGGSMVYTADEDRVNENLTEMLSDICMIMPDILLVQEIDEDCSRTYGINEIKRFTDVLNAVSDTGYQSTFAYNFKTKYVPYPLPPVGRVSSGIQTFSAYRINSAERVKLPCPFSWPVSMVNLKRCLAVHRIPVEGSEHELVLINLHLEAYDSGEGKIEQTKLLKEVIETELKKGNYVIAGGDFNQTFSNTDISAYPQQDGKWVAGRIDIADFDENLTFVMDASIPTCRSLDQVYAKADLENFQYYVLDGFIVSNNIKVLSVSTLQRDFYASDHNPVVMRFLLKTEEGDGE